MLIFMFVCWIELFDALSLITIIIVLCLSVWVCGECKEKKEIAIKVTEKKERKFTYDVLEREIKEIKEGEERIDK